MLDIRSDRQSCGILVTVPSIRPLLSLAGSVRGEGCEDSVSARQNGPWNSLHGRAADHNGDARDSHGRRHVPPSQVSQSTWVRAHTSSAVCFAFGVVFVRLPHVAAKR